MTCCCDVGQAVTAHPAEVKRSPSVARRARCTAAASRRKSASTRAVPRTRARRPPCLRRILVRPDAMQRPAASRTQAEPVRSPSRSAWRPGPPARQPGPAARRSPPPRRSASARQSARCSASTCQTRRLSTPVLDAARATGIAAVHDTFTRSPPGAGVQHPGRRVAGRASTLPGHRITEYLGHSMCYS